MKNLFDEKTISTDPDNLQFCLPISEFKFWYCEPNGYNDLLLPDSKSKESQLLRKYLGYPQMLLEDAKTDSEVMTFMKNPFLWLSGEIDIRNISKDDQIGLLADYGYKWEDFDNSTERNQIIAENYFESYPMDFRNDI